MPAIEETSLRIAWYAPIYIKIPIYLWTHTQLTLEQHRFELCRSIYMLIFSINIQLTFYIPGFHIHGFNQPKQHFQSMLGNPRMWRAEYMHCPMPFYAGDLGILGFWYPWGTWNPLQILREDCNLQGVKLYADVLLCEERGGVGGLVLLTPVIQGSGYMHTTAHTHICIYIVYMYVCTHVYHINYIVCMCVNYIYYTHFTNA